VGESVEESGSEEKMEELKGNRDEMLRLMNSFRAVTEATKVVINYHKMGKKDPMNKIYSNIFSVLDKESRKLENQFELDEINIRLKIRAENAKIQKRGKVSDYGMTKELAGTSEGRTDCLT
jgi:regulator of sigma D